MSTVCDELNILGSIRQHLTSLSRPEDARDQWEAPTLPPAIEDNLAEYTLEILANRDAASKPAQKMFWQDRAANQALLDSSLAKLEGRPEARFFYAYHTPRSLIACDRDDVTLMGSQALAEQVLDASMFSWLLFRAS